jgi:hypothetical protein
MQSYHYVGTKAERITHKNGSDSKMRPTSAGV